jgi:hypothetical protein
METELGFFTKKIDDSATKPAPGSISVEQNYTTKITGQQGPLSKVHAGQNHAIPSFFSHRFHGNYGSIALISLVLNKNS